MARWMTAKRTAYQTLIENEIFHFPVNVEKTIRDNGYLLTGLQEAAAMANITPAEYKDMAMGDGDGVTFYHGQRDLYRVVYKENKTARTRFTLAHELGHIKLKHLEENESLHYGRNDRKEKALETEADVFAGRFLAPFTVMHLHSINSVEDVMKFFGLSYEAANVKIAELCRLNRLTSMGKCIMFKEALEYDTMYREYWGGNYVSTEKKEQMVCSG